MTQRIKIALISPIGEGWPTELYRNLAPLLMTAEDRGLEVTLINSIGWWIWAHMNSEKFDIIISSIPFLFRPIHSKFILHVHGDYRSEWWFRSMGSVLAYLYPFTSLFSDALIFPSDYLKDTLQLKHKAQHVIGNFCGFSIQEGRKSPPANTVRCITITNWNNPKKSDAMIGLTKSLIQGWDSDIQLHWSVISGGTEKVVETIENLQRENTNISIHLVGSKKNIEIEKLLEESDIFLYATSAETFGIAILEAATKWLPLILAPHPAFDKLWNKEAIIPIEHIPEEIQKLCWNQDYYSQRSSMSLQDAKRFEKKTILQSWYTFIDHVYRS